MKSCDAAVSASVRLPCKFPAIYDRLDELERSSSWLARKIGLSPSHLFHILHGRRPLHPIFRLRIAQVLGVSDELLFPEEE
jgi:plasmid maintenance system antidote protein VapI